MTHANGSRGQPLTVPRADEFPVYPASWYYFGRSRDVTHVRPTGRNLFGRRLVAFRTTEGQAVAMEARCSHFGADLSRGCIRDNSLQCEFHHWRFGADGRCHHIPITENIPSWARQFTYPVVERHGLVFVFNGAEPSFPLPFFPNCRPEEFTPSPPFVVTLRCPWYLVGANAFDLQHFRAAHDRVMVGECEIESPSQFARRSTALFDVCSDSLRDRVTRALAGPQVTMSTTDWCGNLLFTTARFRRTCSYGMVATEPLAAGGVTVRVFVFVPRSPSSLGRMAFDPLHARIRRQFVKAFLSADIPRLNDTPYQAGGLIAEDKVLADYFVWLAKASRGQPTMGLDHPAPRPAATLASCPKESL